MKSAQDSCEKSTFLASEYSECFPGPFQVANLDHFPASFTDLPIRSEASYQQSVSTDGRPLTENSQAAHRCGSQDRPEGGRGRTATCVGDALRLTRLAPTGSRRRAASCKGRRSSLPIQRANEIAKFDLAKARRSILGLRSKQGSSVRDYGSHERPVLRHRSHRRRLGLD